MKNIKFHALLQNWKKIIGFINVPVHEPGQEPKSYTAEECEEIGRIAVVLFNFHGIPLGKVTKDYIKSVHTISRWAREFVDNYGILTPEQIQTIEYTWEEIVIHWGKLRLNKLVSDGI